MSDLIAEALSLLQSAKSSVAETLSALESAAPSAFGGETSLLEQACRTLTRAQDEHFELAHLLLRIERRQKALDGMRFEHPVYWRTSSGGREGPFCPTCWEGKHVASVLKTLPFRGHDRWVCHTCSKTFFSEGAQAAMEAAERSAKNYRGGLPHGMQVDE